eukprot:2549864-Pleurochrysis_carterae.AAC.1
MGEYSIPAKSVLDREASRYTTSLSVMFSSSSAEGSSMRTPLMRKVMSERTKYVSSDDGFHGLAKAMACTPHDLDGHDPDVVDSVFVEAGLPGFAANALFIAYVADALNYAEEHWLPTVRQDRVLAVYVDVGAHQPRRRLLQACGGGDCNLVALQNARHSDGIVEGGVRLWVGVLLPLTLAWTYRRKVARRASRIAGSTRASSGLMIGSKLTILANCFHRFQASSSLASVLCAAALRPLSARTPQRRESVLMSTREAIELSICTLLFGVAQRSLASRPGQ